MWLYSFCYWFSFQSTKTSFISFEPLQLTQELVQIKIFLCLFLCHLFAQQYDTALVIHECCQRLLPELNHTCLRKSSNGGMPNLQLNKCFFLVEWVLGFFFFKCFYDFTTWLKSSEKMQWQIVNLDIRIKTIVMLPNRHWKVS